MLERYWRNSSLAILAKTTVVLLVLIATSGCQSARNYNDYLIEKSVASEIPTLMGNVVGGAVSTPFLLISAPVSYAVYWDEEEKRGEFTLAPVKTGAYGGGILLGTPFLPLGLVFARDIPESGEFRKREEKAKPAEE